MNITKTAIFQKIADLLGNCEVSENQKRTASSMTTAFFRTNVNRKSCIVNVMLPLL